MFLVSAHEMRLMDRLSIDSFGIPERVLMENAGRGAACYFLDIFLNKNLGYVGILAGRGNNGGDSFVVARYLSQKNIPIIVFLLFEKKQIKSTVSSANLDLLISLGVTVVEVPNMDAFNEFKAKFRRCSVWVDGILGTGLKSCVEGFLKEIIEFINDQNDPIFSLDIPSGINSDTGQICGTCICAYATVAFGFAKIGHFLYPGRNHVGKFKVIEIGIPLIVANDVGCSQKLLNFNYVKKHFISRPDDFHKGRSGHLLVIAGSPGKTGAAVMTSLGAMRSGAGLVTLCIPEKLHCVVESMLVEVMTVGLPETTSGEVNKLAFNVIEELMPGKKCIVFGPGIGVGSGALWILEQLLKNCSLPLIIDADGLNIISTNTRILKSKLGPVVLTPHPGEMARMLGVSITRIQSDRVFFAREFAEKFNVYIVLKGAGTVIAHPNGRIFINSTGNSGMASAGMGDVLAGMIASFVAQGYEIGFSVELAVYLHGLSGDKIALLKGPYGYLATDVIEHIPKQIGSLCSNELPSLLENIDSLMYEAGM